MTEEPKQVPEWAKHLTVAMGMLSAMALLVGQMVYWFIGPDAKTINYETWPAWLGSGVVFAALGATGFAGVAASRKGGK